MPTPSPTVPSRSLRDLALELELDPPEQDVEITGLGTIESAGPSDLTFLANDRYALRLKESRAGAALVPADFEGEAPMPLLRTDRPRLVFARLLSLYHPPRERTVSRHPTAVVPESCSIGENVSVGAYVVLGENVRVGAGSVLHPHCVLYDDVVLGSDCEIHSHVSLREGSVLGDRVVIHNGSVIGADGFGFEPDEKGHLQRVPQVGIVEIGDDVDIQANACVDRAALGATVVGEGTKIDNFAQIAHGCTIGRHTVICGHVGLAGSTKVGNHVMLGGQVGCSGHLEIGDGAQIAASSGVIWDVPAGAKMGGTPAIPMKDAIRTALYAPRVPEISRRLKKVERTLAKLETKDA